MPKWEASRSKNKHFALYVLPFERFRWIMKFDETRTAKGHPKPSQIGAAGAQGMDFSDLGTVSIFDVIFSWISLSAEPNGDPTGTQPGPNLDPT